MLQWDILAIPSISAADGVLRLDARDGHATFGVSVSNVGAAASITVVPTDDPGTGSTELPLVFLVCQLDDAGEQMSEPYFSTTFELAAEGTAVFAVYAFAQGAAIAYDAAEHRVYVNFLEGELIRGGTSVAITTES